MYSHPSGRERAHKTLVLRVLSSSPRNTFLCLFPDIFTALIGPEILGQSPLFACQNSDPGPELLDILTFQH